MRRVALVFILVFVLYVSHADGRAVQKRDLSDDVSRYLTSLYNRFLNLFQTQYSHVQSSRQYAVMTVNHPDNLLPCSQNMNTNNFLSHLNSVNNYVAYTPEYVDGYIEQHSEPRALNTLDYYAHNLYSVYLVTYYSPCVDCARRIAEEAARNEGVQFYIGYITQYQPDNMNNQIQVLNLLNRPNIHFGQVPEDEDHCHSELRKRDTSCPVQHGCESNDADDGGCFPSSALVHTDDPSSPVKRMDELTIGDQVLVANNHGEVTYSPIIAFLDRLPSKEGEFVRIETENNNAVQLTPSHLLFLNNSNQPVRASTVQPGNYVYTLNVASDKRVVTLSKVIDVYKIPALGAYAPLTSEGTIIVDGVSTSCYVEVPEQHRVHAAFAPLRWMNQVLPSLVGTNQEGVHWYAKIMREGIRLLQHYLPEELYPISVKYF